MVGRIPILQVMPVVDLGRQAAKATVGEPMPVSATVFREGHDRLGAEVVATDPSGTRRPPIPLVKHPERPDFYEARVTPDVVGPWTFEVQAWSDPIGTWQHAAGLKIPAGVDVELMFTEGRLLLERVRAELTDARDEAVVEGAHRRRRGHRPAGRGAAGRAAVPRADPACSRPTRSASWSPSRAPTRCTPTVSARCSAAWYEFFPRSEGATEDPKTGKVTSGTFRTALKRLDYVADLGFDVIYLPPIHPIGEVNRKGPNNTLTPGPDDTGSPWAIGSKDGGHDAIHPDLGTIEDFDAFVARAGELGLEVALDLALQAAPDHPWVADQPGVVHHPRRRVDRLRREPAEEVPGHLPDQLRQRPDRHLSRGAAHRQALDVARRADLPGRQPAHQAGGVLGVAAARDPRGPTPT